MALHLPEIGAVVTVFFPGTCSLFRVQVGTVMSEIDIFISSTSFITSDHKKLLKNSTFVGNTEHFDNEVDFAGSEGLDTKPQKIAPAFQSSLPRFADEAFEWVFRTFPRFQKSADSDRQCGDDPAGGNFHAERSSSGSCRSRRALQLMDASSL